MIIYCEDIYTCRRVQQLSYFGESFDAAACNETCDNCRNRKCLQMRDVSGQAKDLTQVRLYLYLSDSLYLTGSLSLSLSLSISLALYLSHWLSLSLWL